MAGVDTFNLQPFLADPTIAIQGYPSSEPFEAANGGAKVGFFPLADEGYPPYGSTMVTTNGSWFGRVMAPLGVGILILAAWEWSCAFWKVPKYLFPARPISRRPSGRTGRCCCMACGARSG